MDLEPTDEQGFLRESIRGTVDRAASLARVREWVLGEEIDHGAAHAIAVRQGWTGIGVPEALGGQGGDLLEMAILAEELGRGAVPADALYASLIAATALIPAAGDPDAAARITAIAEGETVAALACAGDRPADAPTAGAPLALVPGAPAADLLLAWTGTGLDLHHPGPGTATAPRRLVDRTRAVADVTLDGAPAAHLPGVGTEEMRAVAARAAVLVAADALGACTRMLELTVEYVGQRVQFGVPVGSFQAVKHAAAEMLVSIEGTRAAVQYAAWAVGAGEPGAETDAWVAKSRASRTALHVADRALFLHGAVGYTWEHDLGLLFKRAKSDAALFGGAALYEDRIADALALVTEPVLS